MTKINLLPADTYIIVNRTIITDQDRKLLIMLYQPIIGMIAVNLYLNFWSYLEKSEILSNLWTHHHLINNMGLTISEFNLAREKLEGIGLLKTYIKKENVNNLIYELYSPLSAYEFFNNPILSTSLYTTIGKNEFEQIKEYFKMPEINLTGYENITSTFTDIFASANLITTPVTNIKKRKTQNLNCEIDLDSLLETIPSEMLNHRNITKEIKELIYKLNFIYDLKDTELNDIIRNSIDEKHNIDMNLLRNNARNFYQFENSGHLPSIVNRNQPEFLRKKISDPSKRNQLIYQFETTSPYDFLCSKYKGAKPPKTDLNILEYLLIDMKLNPGVVNVLIDYVLKINDNKLIRPFIETIAGQWKRSNIETVEAAMNIAEREYKNKKTVKSKKVEIKPTWFDKEINETVDMEKQKELEEILKEFR